MNSYTKIDLLTIVFIIVLSYLFAVSANKSIDIQVLFIVFGLCIMVAHKISYKILSKKEPFDGGSDLSAVIANLNSFVNNTKNTVENSNMSENQNQTEIASLNTNLESIKASLDVINASIINSNNSDSSDTSNYNTNDRMSLESQHALQSYQIKFLQDQIKKTNDLINAKTIQDNMTKYKPIKVYSSCAVIKPDNTGENMSDLVMTSQDNVTTPTNSQLLNTIGQNNNSNFLNDVLGMLNKVNNKSISI